MRQCEIGVTCRCDVWFYSTFYYKPLSLFSYFRKRFGVEVVIQFSTGYSNNKTFYTDSNGLEEQQRIINYRPTWPLVINEPVAGNYYPINSHIVMKDVSDQNKKVVVLTDRSQGGSVIKEGVI